MAGALYAQQRSFGDKAVPQGALTLLALRGGNVLSGTRLRFAYSEGIKEPRFEETFGISGTSLSNPNPNLKPEKNRALEAGLQQSLLAARYRWQQLTSTTSSATRSPSRTASAPFYRPVFQHQSSLAHGAEAEFHGRLRSSLSLDAATCTPQHRYSRLPAPRVLNATGEPLLRRPKHSGSVMLNYFGKRWGGDVAGSFVGRRPDSDFLFGVVPPQDHAAGYALVNIGGWYAINRYMTAYVNVENVLNRRL